MKQKAIWFIWIVPIQFVTEMKSNQENLRNRKTADWSVLAEDSSVDSGFVINPDNESISIITDEFDPSISSEATDSTPLGNLVGRFSFFGTNMVSSVKL